MGEILSHEEKVLISAKRLDITSLMTKCTPGGGREPPHPPTWLEPELNLWSHDLPPREKAVMAGQGLKVTLGG